MLKTGDMKFSSPVKQEEIKSFIEKKLGLAEGGITGFRLLRRSVDARKKPDLVFIYRAAFSCPGENRLLKKRIKGLGISKYVTDEYEFPYKDICVTSKSESLKQSPAIVGSGPAGLFAALTFVKAGMAPVILERGKEVDERMKDVAAFWNGGALDGDSNVQFGEGGAGTFSDGKLNTGINSARAKAVLKIFTDFGADPEILYDSRPHLGTDKLIDILKNIRRYIEDHGGTYRFSSKVTGIAADGGKLRELIVNDRETVKCSHAVFAIGHSARDTFSMLEGSGLLMEPKAFAAGYRIMHPQELIDISQYGNTGKTYPYPASYKLTGNVGGTGVYSFCMCPGGYVVNASSEPGYLAVNGMSFSRRDGRMANSAIVTAVSPEDVKRYLKGTEVGCGGNDPLAGVRFQRMAERKAYLLAGGAIPSERFGDFASGGTPQSADIPCVKGKAEISDLHGIMPREIEKRITEGIRQFGKKIMGFDRDEALLLGVEPRTSSPVRILRDDRHMSCISGIYPCGEGAGYAGGIVSAASDGIKTSEFVISDMIKN